MNRIVWATLVASLAVVGCNKGTSYQAKPAPKIEPAKVNPGQEASLFPFKEGNQWIYSLTQEAYRGGRYIGKGSAEVTYRVAKVSPVGDGVKATLSLIQNGKPIDQQVWLSGPKGLYQLTVGTKDVPFTPSLPVVKFPVESRQKFTWKGKGIMPNGLLGTSTIDTTILEPQEIDAEVDRFSAIPIQTKSSFNVNGRPGTAASTAFFRPGVGLVRFRQEVVYGQDALITILSLKNYTLKQ